MVATPSQPPSGPPSARARLAAAARDLFADRGYEQTTVEAIADRAGVGRRTFFRHFRSKDDAIFPDHQQLAEGARGLLEAMPDQPPLRAVCAAVRLVFRSYVDDPVVSVQRYRLTRSVPALRDRETASVSQYTRLFAGYLRSRSDQSPQGLLRADVGGAAVVAAHNTVLRDWLQAGGGYDPMPALDAAFEWVVAAFEAGDRAAAAATGDGAADDSVVVAVFRAGDRLDDVVQRISRSL